MGLRLAPMREEDMHIGPFGAADSAGRAPARMFAPGTVVAESPPAGSRVDGTSLIALTVAK
jgi:hypothetical protein